MTRRVIRPLRLTRTALPTPGHRSIKGAHARGYAELDGETIDLTRVDPSFAGAAGACALVVAKASIQWPTSRAPSGWYGRCRSRGHGVASSADDDEMPG